MNNLELRKIMKEKKVPMWKIADYLHVHENTISRLFRHELSNEKKEKIYQIIIKLSE